MTFLFSHRPQIMVFLLIFSKLSTTPYFTYRLLSGVFLFSFLHNTIFITAKTAFHHCTRSFIAAHFVHHCTLKQEADFKNVRG